MPLFKLLRKKEKSSPADNGRKQKKDVGGGKPPLNVAKSEGFLRRSSKKEKPTGVAATSSFRSTGSNGSRGSGGKKQKKQQLQQQDATSSSGLQSLSASSSNSSLLKIPHDGHSVSPPQSHATVSSSCNNSDAGDDNSSHNEQSSTTSSSFKKASLARSSSVSSQNPKTLIHSTSAIGLDEMIEDRREGGHLGQNVVHIEVPFGKPIEEVYDGVHNGPVLGSGISGMVRLVTHKATGLKYAVKVLDLGLVETPTGLQQLREEIFIMCQLDHPNIVRLEEVYESHTEIYLVQELCLGGELFDRLDEQPDYHYTEAECARLVKQMLSAVRYLHQKGIIHRDLKLENFLFSSVHPDSELKMIDFGLSKHFRYGEVHHEAVGTPYTVAPEVIRGSYDERCDIWAIGVISFLLLSGEPPFGGCGGPEPLMTVRANILNGTYAFEPADIWELVSPQALDFIRSLLVTDPQQRPTAQSAQQHGWFLEWARRTRREKLRSAPGGDLSSEDEDDEPVCLNPNVVKALVNFKEFSDMRKLLCEVLSFTLLPDQIRDLRREFEKMDTDGSGEISLSALKHVLMQNAGAGSLGALTEEEVTDIFDAMRVRKTETRIHWHEFIAAGLSQCSVDDRNLRLAFERLDADHKGYITLDDIMDLMGSDALQSEDAMRQMWGDSIKAVKCQHARITYDDFLLLMKGQTREHPPDHTDDVDIPLSSSLSALGSSLRNLQAVPESGALTDESGSTEAPKTEGTGPGTPLRPLVSSPGSVHLSGSHSAPTTPSNHKKIIGISHDDDDDFDSPLSMDDELPAPTSLTPPMTPERGASDYLSPRNKNTLAQDFTLNPRTANDEPPDQRSLLLPSFPDEPLGQYVRRRSRSLGNGTDDPDKRDDSDNKEPVPQVTSQSSDAGGEEDLHAVADAVRELLLPEADHGAHVPAELGEVVKDKTKSALVVNRRLYRAHRKMRMAVMEASKRFEEQQAEHAKEVILAERKKSEQHAVVHAGLVMRHGHTKQVSSEAIRAMLAKDRAEQQSLVEKATRRGGRGRRSRKKTISDMSQMLVNMGSEDFNPPTGQITRGSIGGASGNVLSPPESNRSSMASVSEPFTPESSEIELPVDVRESAPPRRSDSGPKKPTESLAPSDSMEAGTAKEGTMRGATVPGEFRKTSDPFGSQGKYGAVMSNW